MKKRILQFMPFLAALTLAGCASEEIVTDETGSNDNKGLNYIAVNIVQPSSMGSRADTKFENGSSDENEAKKALFIIFDGDGNIYGDPQLIDLISSEDGTNSNVERIYNGILVIDGSEYDPTEKAKQIVCVLNPPTELLPAGDQWPKVTKSIKSLEANIGDYSSHKAGTFIMTNSVFAKDGKFATPIDADKVKESETAALASPVDIYVERIVAKVRASASKKDNQGQGGFRNDGANPTIDGVETKLGINVTGIEIANIADKSYLFKSVAGAKDATEGIWTEASVFDETYKRSYWETVPKIGTEMGIFNRTYNDILALDGKNEDGTDKTFNINDVNNYTEYVQPNTSDTKDTKTCVLVTAELTKEGTPIKDLAYIRGGYTTIDKAKNVVATYLARQNWYKKAADDDKFTQLEPEDLEWKNKYDFEDDKNTADEVAWLKDYEVVAQLSADVKEIYDADGKEVNNGVNSVNKHLRTENLAKNYRARVFDGGKCYYYVYIDQSQVVNAASETYLGVVRNHIYDLTLQSIGGIGTPVFDPNDIIIPQTPEDKTTFYLNARVNVLAWKVATQTVNFQGK